MGRILQERALSLEEGSRETFSGAIKSRHCIYNAPRKNDWAKLHGTRSFVEENKVGNEVVVLMACLAPEAKMLVVTPLVISLNFSRVCSAKDPSLANLPFPTFRRTE